MQVAAFVILLLILLICGIGGLFFGIVGLSVGILLRKNQISWSKPFAVFGAIILAFSIPMTLIPAAFFGFVYYVNTVPPLEFVETEIVIEEDGYQDERFTADGVLYEVLPLPADYDGCYPIATPVFSYYTEGFMNGSECGNYYRLENDSGCELIWDGDQRLFARLELHESIVAYYQTCPTKWYYYDWTDYEGEELIGIPLTPEAEKAAGALYALDSDAQSAERLTLPAADYIDLTLHEVSADGIVYFDSISIGIINGDVFLTKTDWYVGEDEVEYTGTRLPDELARPLREMLEGA